MNQIEEDIDRKSEVIQVLLAVASIVVLIVFWRLIA
jgi:hypothetical protein